MSILIKNGKWLGEDGAFHDGDILIEGDKIAGIDAVCSTPRTERVIDAGGRFILPGLIDTHVHFREPGQEYKEGIFNASKAALKGGVTSVLDMPNNVPPITSGKILRDKKKLFSQKCLVNWGLQFHTQAGENEKVGGIAAAKMYMAKSSALPAVTETDDITAIFKRFASDVPVTIHAEDETAFVENGGKYVHHLNRPKEAITSALGKIETALKRLRKEERPKVVICHIATREEVQWIERMKNDGYEVYAETCPHYLYLTQDDYLREGAPYKVNPPIRSEEDQDALRRALKNGVIDFIGTDHAPHTREEKSGDNPPSGIAGIEWLAPLMLNFVDEGLIDWKRYWELTAKNAADCFNISGRSAIVIDAFADLIIVENGQKEDNIITKAGFNPYKNKNLNWRVTTAIVNGKMVYNNGMFFDKNKGVDLFLEG
jgi:dihydroorotase